MNSRIQNTSPFLWAEVYPEAIADNCRLARRTVPENTRVMAVVKADGYGHGAVQTARAALKSGADCLAVARLEEAVTLRRAGIRADILIFGAPAPEQVDQLLEQDLIQTVFDLETSTALSRRARSLGGRLRAHLKVDTGMGRLGVVTVREGVTETEPHGEALDQAEAIACLPGLGLEGIYTHFARADEPDRDFTRLQLARFHSVVDGLRERGIEIPLRHAANSAALLAMPETHLDLVRPGLMLYGLTPLVDKSPAELGLSPALSLKARIAQVKRVGPDFPVSYGSKYATDGETWMGTLPVGYADGYRRCLSPGVEVLFRGRRARVAGQVCMDQTVVDLGEAEAPQTGEEVVLLGEDGNDRVSAEELAWICRTISYEIVTALTSRVPRVYRATSRGGGALSFTRSRSQP
ncbi:MAG: alanine racemase [Desulfohalobiaceae bacterium]|nr:alanine racemase [Desulfohalobiaceae bacterium]